MRKAVLSFVCKWPWAKVKKWPWPSILTYFHFFSWFQVTGCKCSENQQFSLFPIEKPKFPIWPCRKIGQDQPRVIILTNYDRQESPMLHTRFCGNRHASSKEDFWRVFTIYRRGGHLGHVTQMPRTNFRSSYPRRLHIKFGYDRPSGFREEDVWNCGRRRWTTYYGRTTDGRRTMGIL